MAPDQETLAWLTLGLVAELTPSGFRKLLAALSTPEAICAADRATLSRSVSDDVAAAIRRGPDQDRLDATLRWLEEPANRVVTFADDDYPRLLLEITDPPPLLFVKGRPKLLGRASLAVVGSRNATQQGCANARAFSQELSEGGLTIVSGLALGIDAAAHAGGLAAAASSIAVVGTGLDIVYPARNRDLAQHLAEEGALVSEFALGTPALASNFPRRNRLISGLARGCLVVEAALKSGSLITARYALEQGREVFAIPGSIHSPLSKGCHLLIKQGAKLAESSQDILEELGAAVAQRATTISPDDEVAHENPLLAALGFDPLDLDTLCQRSGLTPDSASAMLLTLELEGSVSRLPGGKFQRLR
ncbi:MAG TPA: DNA-processing protein DprA [Burkholderiales bacterium]|nr:DNA-processing protein DprA [Burkholderiales bacterium]